MGHAAKLVSGGNYKLPAVVGLLTLFSVAGLSIAGCGGSKDPFSYVKVKGKVTYADGSLIPASRIRLIFNSEAPQIDAKTYPRPGGAEVNVQDGTFDTVTTEKYGDGLVVGKHKVQVLTMDKNEQPNNMVPPEFKDAKKTPVEINTDDGDLKILVNKPVPGAAGQLPARPVRPGYPPGAPGT